MRPKSGSELLQIGHKSENQKWRRHDATVIFFDIVVFLLSR